METNGDKRPLRRSGYYQHKETGAVVYLQMGETGTGKIDAFVQAGFVYYGPDAPKVEKPAEETPEEKPEEVTPEPKKK